MGYDNKHGHGHGRNHHQQQRQRSKANFDENNPVLQMFSQISKELDDKHDRYERIVKLSRDVTIEAKRIIFLLHTVDPLKDNKAKVLSEAEERLIKICVMMFKKIGKELQGHDQYQYLRAFTFGLQEFIEAWTFFNYINDGKVDDWTELQRHLTYKLSDEEPEKTYLCIIPPTEYILGLGDQTGEVMRRCINSLGSGDTDECFNATNFLRQIYTGFSGIGHTNNRDFGQKYTTLKQSMLKCETVCYNVKVRGTEAAKWGQGQTTTTLDDNKDEGFY